MRLRALPLCGFAALVAGPVLAPGADVSLATGDTPQGIVAVDLSGNGHVDLATVNAFDGRLVIHHGDGAGGFVEAQSLAVGPDATSPFNYPRHVAFTDFNRDQRPDLVVLCSGNFAFGVPPSIQTFLNLGSGTFAPFDPLILGPVVPVTDLFPVHFVIGEFTGDAYADVAVARKRQRTVELLAGNGTGSFVHHGLLATPGHLGEPEYLLAVDFGGGSPSLLVAGDDMALLLPRASGAAFGTEVELTLPALPAKPRALAWDDIDGDGAGDLLVADAEGRIQALYGLTIDGNVLAAGTLGGSLVNPVHLATLPWDGDLLPDVAVAAFGEDTRRIVASMGANETLPSASEPRRVVHGDFNSDGRVDLAGLNQGNDPGADVEIHWSAAPLPPQVSAGSITGAGTTLGTRIDRPRAITTSIPSKMWVVDGTGFVLNELSPQPTLHSNPSARFGQTNTMPFQVGGIYFLNQNNGRLMERHAGRLHEFHRVTGLGSNVAVAYDPGPLGFSGLAMDEATNEFFAGAPGRNEVVRFSTAGTVLGTFATVHPAWDLVWDDTRSLLIASNPGRADLLAYTRAGVVTPAANVDLGHLAPVARRGIAGVARAKNQPNFLVSTSEGLLLTTDDTGTVLSDTTLAPLVYGTSLTYNGDGTHHWMMGRDGFIVAVESSGFTGAKFLSTWPAIAAANDFLPASISFDPTADELFVADRSTARGARFSTAGAFLGFRDHRADLPAADLTGAAIIDQTGQVHYRHAFGLRRQDGTASISLPASSARALGARDGWIVVGAPQPGQILLARLDGTARYAIALDDSLEPDTALAISPEGIIALTPDGVPSLVTYETQPGDNTSVGEWAVY